MNKVHTYLHLILNIFLFRIMQLTLDQLHPDIWPAILKYCTLREKKSLRLVNRTLLDLLDSLDHDLKHVIVRRAISPGQLSQLADECTSLLGLECYFQPKHSQGLDGAVANLVEKHVNLRKIKITAEEDCPKVIALQDQGLSALLRLRNLTDLCLEHTLITGDNLQLQDDGDCLSQLKVLNLSGCGRITEAGINNLLGVCGQKLKELDLSNTDLSGAGLRNGREACFPRLEKLNLQECMNLSNSGLNGILAMCGAGLRDLNLAHCSSITGASISSACPVLESLDLNNCTQITDDGLNKVLRVWGGGHLRSLNLSSTRVAGTSTLSTPLPGLQNLNLRACDEVSDAGINHLGRLWGARLTELNLSYTRVTGSRIGASLPCLASLNLDGCCWLSDAGLDLMLKSWGRASLRSLSLMHTYIMGTNIETPCPHLERLILNNCRKIANEGLVSLLMLWGSELRELDLNYTRISGTNTANTGACSRMEKLYLTDCLSLTDSGLNSLLQLCSHSLQVLSLASTEITGTGLDLGLPRLEHLDLNTCQNLNESHLNRFLTAGCNPGLKYLDLSRTKFSGTLLLDGGCGFDQLESLRLDRCEQLTDPGLAKLLLHICGTGLKEVSLSWTEIHGSRINRDVGSGKFPRLESLDLYCCRKLTGKGVANLISLGGPALKRVNLKHTPWQTINNFMALVSNL